MANTYTLPPPISLDLVLDFHSIHLHLLSPWSLAAITTAWPGTSLHGGLQSEAHSASPGLFPPPQPSAHLALISFCHWPVPHTFSHPGLLPVAVLGLGPQVHHFSCSVIIHSFIHHSTSISETLLCGRSYSGCWLNATTKTGTVPALFRAYGLMRGLHRQKLSKQGLGV